MNYLDDVSKKDLALALGCCLNAMKFHSQEQFDHLSAHENFARMLDKAKRSAPNDFDWQGLAHWFSDQWFNS